MVVRSSTGSTRAPDSCTLYNNIQYKQWNRPSIPKQYLSDTKTLPAIVPSTAGAGVVAGRVVVKKSGKPAPKPPKETPVQKTPERLVNPAFDEEALKPLGVRIGRVALF
jgi:hypothetical protein